MKRQTEKRIRKALIFLNTANEVERGGLLAIDWVTDNAERVLTALSDFEPKNLRRIPKSEIEALADQLLNKSGFNITLEGVEDFLAEKKPLTESELWLFTSVLKMSLCRRFAQLAEETAYELTVLRRNKERDKLYAAQLRIDISAVVSSLRAVEIGTWEKSVARLSATEREYKNVGVYARMDGQSRAYYRKCTEKLARKSGLSEHKVAKKAAALARETGEDVGFFLFDERENELRERIGLKKKRCTDRARWYISAVVILTLALSTALTVPFITYEAPIWIGVWSMSLVLTMEIAIFLINRILPRFYPPRFLPKLETGAELSKDESTAVVIPSLMTNGEEARAVVEKLEMYYMTNCIGSLRFVLLGDYADGKNKNESGDEEIKKEAKRCIDALNKKYGGGFYYFQRARVYNGSDRVYSARERKRGSLMDFTRFIVTGNGKEAYELICGEADELVGTRFILTLDTDTALTADSAGKLIGAALHPLNSVRLTDDGKGVKRGYTVFAPRVSVSALSAVESRFAFYYSDESGVDAYGGIASETYMDVMNAASYCGKGLFEAKPFYTLMQGRFPDNLILSHDLIEGSFAHTALVHDVHLYDTFPSGFMSYAKRQNRWIRGDWQLLGYLFPTVRNQKGERIKNTLSVLDRWKIFDNMRRSILPAESIRFFITGALFFPHPWIFALLPVTVWFLPLVASAMGRLALSVRQRTVTLADGFRQLKRTALHTLFNFIFLPYEAYNQIDAVGRSMYRLFVSHCNRLCWVTAAMGDKNKNTFGNMLAYMSPVMAVSVAFVAVAALMGRVLIALPAALTWLASPLLAVWLDGRLPDKTGKLSKADKEKLGMLMKLTWDYFTAQCNSQTNFLPPDNIQIYPPKEAADRTTPSNIGFALIAAAAAFDRGYTGIEELVSFVENVISTVEGLEKWNGHLYNWYRVSNCEVLPPRYVSTVDSGNFVAALLVVAAALEEAKTVSLLGGRRITGMLDEARLLGEKEKCSLLEEALEGDGETAVNVLYKLAVRNSNGVGRMAYGAVTEAETLLPWIKVLRRKTVADAVKEKLYEAQSMAAFERSYPAIVSAAGGDEELMLALSRGASAIRGLNERIEAVRRRCLELFARTDFAPLRSKTRGLFVIGVDTQNGTDENCCYDLKAAEVRQTDYLAIAKGDVPQKQWFMLSSAMTDTDCGRALISWSGTMFEYLMPTLTMPDIKHTLLSQTYASVVRAQIKWGRVRHVPWGVSESGYYAFDRELNYQYKAFGIPSLALKAGMEKETVVAPYATLLALPFAPKECMANLVRLEEEGAVGKYGMYEAVDFTAARVGKRRCAVVRSFMSHHQGMIMAALDNALCHGAIVRKMFSYPFVAAQRLLLEEKCPLSAIGELHHREEKTSGVHVGEEKRVRTPEKDELCLISNGRLSAVLDGEGNFTLRRGRVILGKGNVLNGGRAEACFEENGAVFVTQYTDGALRTHIDVDMQRDALIIMNEWTGNGKVRVRQGMELCLNSEEGYRAHPTYSDLFIGKIKWQDGRLLCSRRIRRGEAPITVGMNWVGSDAVGSGDGFSLEAEKNGKGRMWALIVAGDSENEVTDVLTALARDEQCASAVNASRELSPVRMASLGIKPYQAEQFALLAPDVVNCRCGEEVDGLAADGDSKLYSAQLSAALPILAAEVDDEESVYNADVVLKAHRYYASKGIANDAVILCRDGGYFDTLARALRERIAPFDEQTEMGSVHIVNTAHISEEARRFICSVAVLEAGINGLCATKRTEKGQYRLHNRNCTETVKSYGALPLKETEFFNSFGGFTENGSTYMLRFDSLNEPVPSQWQNVLASSEAGTVVTQDGFAFTWAGNSRLFRLTGEADPSQVGKNEAIYVQDAETGEYWTVTAAPVKRGGTRRVTYRYGAMRWEYVHNGINARQDCAVAPDTHLRSVGLYLLNTDTRKRRLKIYWYVRPELGDGAHKANRRFTARRTDGGVSVHGCNGTDENRLFLSMDRTVSELYLNDWQVEDVTSPLFLRAEVENSALNGDAPCQCAVLGAEITLEPEEEGQINFSMNMGKCALQEKCSTVIQRAKSFYEERLENVRVSTPDRSMDIMLNGWLLYQTLNSRFYARCSVWQCGGAIGFRDQLQDCISLLWTDTRLVREHILLCASKQFKEGDVLHWWHEKSRGVRTRISDDLLFLPYITAEYVSFTGDVGILDERAVYLEGEPLDTREHDRYCEYPDSEEAEELYYHCLRALDKAYAVGEHGLLLMGSGDWNDAMDEVGVKGRGESVWLSMFYCTVIRAFYPLLRNGENEKYAQRLEALQTAINEHGWDGDGYLRAYTDEGEALGSKCAATCRTDLLVQAWSVLSGCAPYERGVKALQRAEDELVDRCHGLIKLFTPPFDMHHKRMGYINSYPPGTRENGGQYTHAAAWYIQALTRMGMGNKAHELFNLINPVNHTRTPMEVRTYKREPFVLCGDVWAGENNAGCGGWSWYTGAAAWMYKTGIEDILGLKKEERRLRIEPCIPARWDGYEIEYRYASSLYRISVHNPQHVCYGVRSVLCDGKEVNEIALNDDGAAHRIRVIMG